MTEQFGKDMLLNLLKKDFLLFLKSWYEDPSANELKTFPECCNRNDKRRIETDTGELRSPCSPRETDAPLDLEDLFPPRDNGNGKANVCPFELFSRERDTSHRRVLLSPFYEDSS